MCDTKFGAKISAAFALPPWFAAMARRTRALLASVVVKSAVTI
jgi:hypothetical protein